MPSRPVRPKDAATLVLCRDALRGPEVLMGRRPETAAFMPGVYVFPGGKVDPDDARARSASELRAEVLAQLSRRCSPRRARALAMAAIRETFEETGLALGRLGADQGSEAPPAWQEFDRTGLAPALDRLDYLGRAITPPGLPRRFHARFFLADAADAHGAPRSNGELLDVGFVPLEQARLRPTANVTWFVLDELARTLAAPPSPGRPRLVFTYVKRHPRIHYE